VVIGNSIAITVFGRNGTLEDFTINAVRDADGKVLYATITYGPRTIPQCGIVPYCVHISGGYAWAYNPSCADDIKEEDVMPCTMPTPSPVFSQSQAFNTSQTADTSQIQPVPTPEQTMFETPGLTLLQYPSQTSTPNSEDDQLLGGIANNTSSFKWDAWKYSTIGLGAATIAFGTVAAVFVVKSVRKCIRNKNEIQIELIDDPALTHTLLQN
jgi:hypothetical protein